MTLCLCNITCCCVLKQYCLNSVIYWINKNFMLSVVPHSTIVSSDGAEWSWERPDGPTHVLFLLSLFSTSLLLDIVIVLYGLLLRTVWCSSKHFYLILNGFNE